LACSSATEENGGSGADNVKRADNACHLHTNFAGDDTCIPPPEEGKGMQIHVCPSDYDNPDDVWVLEPGAEPTQNYHLYTPNTEDIYYFKQQYRMRVGSHHMIIQLSNDTTGPEGWKDGQSLNLIGAIGGTQHVVEDYPPGGVVAPEDVGLARKVLAHTAFDIQLHFYNATDKPTLREVWVNFLYEDPASVTQTMGMMGGITGVNVPPHQSVTVGGTCDATQAIPAPGPQGERILSLFGHAHTHNTRFAVFWDKADGSEQLVYDSYEGAEAPQYLYNSVQKNPETDPANKKTGAFSGQLILGPQDSLRYQCDITNDLNISLQFTEQVFTGEMCNLFGSVVGLGFPCFPLK